MVMRRFVCIALVALLAAGASPPAAHARKGHVLGGLLAGLAAAVIISAEIRKHEREEARERELENERLRLEAERAAAYGDGGEEVYGDRPVPVYPGSEDVITYEYPRRPHVRRHRPVVTPLPEHVVDDRRYPGDEDYRALEYRPPRRHRYHRYHR